MENDIHSHLVSVKTHKRKPDSTNLVKVASLLNLDTLRIMTYNGIGCDPYGYKLYMEEMLPVLVDLQMICTNIADSDDLGQCISSTRMTEQIV